MERKMLNVKLNDRIRNTIISQRTRVTAIVEHVMEKEMDWTHHRNERQQMDY